MPDELPEHKLKMSDVKLDEHIIKILRKI